MASWLVPTFPDRAVRVRSLAGETVFCSLARHLGTGGNLTNFGGEICDGLACHLGGVEILLAASFYRNRDKLRRL